MDAKQIIKECELFSELSPFEVLKLTEVSRRVFLPKGEVVISEGEEFEADASLYIIASGVVKVAVQLGSSMELVLAILSPPDFFGDMSFVDHKPRSASAIAMEDAEIIKLDHDKLDSVLEADEALALKFYRAHSAVMVRKLRQMNRKVLEGCEKFKA